ncbi:MAG: VirD4-like conjugal transfer protein, CD1115 family [Christensenellaceae bacterium]
MRHDKFSKQSILLYCLGTIPVIWLALRIAPFMEDGLPGLIQNFGAAMSRPFYITLCGNSLKTILVLLLCYGLAIGIYLSTQRNYRRREEHGSAQWGSPVQVNRKYADKVPTRNKILTQNVSVGLDGRKHRRNLNTLVCGGSGAGKTRFFAKPNLCQANSSYVVLDPKGELLRDTGNLLSAKGYDIKVLDLINMEKSHCYNPFVYLRSDNDIQRLVTNLFKNTTPKGSQSQDPFWDQAATMLLLALIFYLHYEAPPEEQNFPMVMDMIRAGEVREDDETYKSALDILFERLEMRNPEHIALKYYRSYHSGSGKTLKSIQITLISRLEKFNLESLASITQNDELELWSIGEKKTAVFAIIPDNDSSFSFLVGMLYTQLFQQLYYQADVIHGGRLPVHVHFLMDEFANVALPDEFDKLLSTMRSREISVSIIIQNLAQLKALFEKQWESIVGNCDEFLYLGGNEQSTHEYVSKLLGKETIDTNTYGQSKGRNGSYSTNWQLAGRELMTPDEVRMLDNRYALLFIRGERPVEDLKFDILKHPNIALTADGGAGPYRHGEDSISIAALSIDENLLKKAGAEPVSEDEYLFFCEEELEELLQKKTEEKQHEQENQEQD